MAAPKDVVVIKETPILLVREIYGKIQVQCKGCANTGCAIYKSDGRMEVCPICKDYRTDDEVSRTKEYISIGKRGRVNGTTN